MPKLLPCSNCGRHVQATTKHCPHCNTSLGAPSISPRGAALGLALASSVACAGGIGPGEPEYGVAVLMDSGAAQDTSDTDDSGDSGDSGDSSDTGGDDTGGDDTGECAQAEYGVPWISTED